VVHVAVEIDVSTHRTVASIKSGSQYVAVAYEVHVKINRARGEVALSRDRCPRRPALRNALQTRERSNARNKIGSAQSLSAATESVCASVLCQLGNQHVGHGSSRALPHAVIASI